ncbi:MAG: phosphatase PAP2 family protein [Steroidobacteraceae bacterium]
MPQDVLTNFPRLRHVWSRLRQFDLVVLFLLLLVSGLLLAFSKLASEVMEGETDAFDRMVLLALRDAADLTHPAGPAWLEIIFRDLTSLGSLPVVGLVSAVVMGFLWVSGRPAVARLILVSVSVGGILSVALKSLFLRPRPELFPHGVEAQLTSFPSGHAMLAAVVYLTLGALLAHVQTQPRVRSYCMAVAIVLTLLVGISRVYLGVHWPTDVFAGWCVGSAWAMLCLLVAIRRERRSSGQMTQSPPRA